MNSFLLWIGGLLVAVLCAVFAVPHFVDWNRYRGVFEEEATRVLGREVRVAGKVNLRLLPSPYVTFEKVRVADTVGGTGEAFFRAEGLSIRLAIAPLLHGTLEAREIELDTPTLRIAVDATGKPSWQDFQLAPGATGILASGVAFDSVLVKRGTAVVVGADRREMMRLEEIEGDVGATAIHGPYKARALTRWQGEMREVRLSTAARDPDGGVRFKLAIRTPGTQRSYAIDGKVSDLAGAPRVEGEVVARLQVGASAQAAGKSAAKQSPVAVGAQTAELRSRLTMDAFGAKLTELAIAFDSDGRPQQIDGTAEAVWSGEALVRTALVSRWLDLDRLGAAPGVAANPFKSGLALLADVLADIDLSERWEATLALDQATLGGETIGAVQLDMARNAGSTRINRLRATLPGGARLDLGGTLGRGVDASRFDGELAVRGASLARFSAWAGKGLAMAEARSDGPFALQGKLRLTSGGLELASVEGEHNSGRFIGDAAYFWEGRPRLKLTVEGSSIDLGAFLPGALSMPEIRKVLAQPLPAAQGKPIAAVPPSRVLDPSATDLVLAVRAGRLIDGERTLRDVDVALAVEANVLTLSRLRFLTTRALGVDLDGELRAPLEAPKGTLSGSLEIPNAAALADWLELASPIMSSADAGPRLAPLLPARIAGVAQIGRRSPSAIDITADGHLAGGRLGAVARFDAGLGARSGAPAEVTLAYQSSDIAQLLALAGREVPAGRSGREQVPGRVLVKVSGEQGAGFATFAEVEGEGFALAMNGRLSLPQAPADAGGAPPLLAGELRVQAAEAGRLIGLAGLGGLGALGEIPVEGVANFTASGDGFRIEPRGLYVAGSQVSGHVTLAGPQERRRINARLSATEASLPRLAGLIVSGGAAGGGDAIEPGRWPDRAFDGSRLSTYEGSLRLEAASLVVDRNMTVEDAVLVLELAPRAVIMRSLDGRAAGGRLTARGRLDVPASGAQVALDMRIAGAPLAAGGSPAAGFATGSVGLAAELSGRAASPRAMIGALTGKGVVELEGVTLARLSSSAVDRAADLFLTGRIEAGQEQLGSSVRSELARYPLALGTRKVPVEIGDGVFKLKSFAIDAPDARIVNATTFELASGRFDSEWRIEPKSIRPAGRGTKSALPAVSVIYGGSLASQGRIEPRLQLDALERDLAVRKLEQDVDELERLRKLDEERSQNEADRARALEAASQAAAQAAASQAAAAPGADAAAGESAAAGVIAPAPIAVPRPSPAPSRPTSASPRFDPFKDFSVR